MARHRSRVSTFTTVSLLLLSLAPLQGLAAVAAPPALRPTVLWSHPLKKIRSLGRGLYQFTQPVLHNGALYVGSATGGVFALTTEGNPMWTTMTEGPVYAPVTIQNDTLYAADSEGVVYALDLAHGGKQWQTTVGGEIMSRPLVVEHLLYVVTTAGELIALDRNTGVPRWHTGERLTIAEFAVRGAADPIFHQGHIVVGYADGRLTAHNPNTGDIVWEERIARPTAPLHDVDATPYPMGGQLIAASIGNGLAAVDGHSGHLMWFEPIGSPYSEAMADDTIFVAGGGTVYALNPKTGGTKWKQALPNISETSSPVVVGDTIVVCATEGPVFLLDRKSGAILGAQSIGKGTYGRPLADGDRVYVATNGHRVVALQIPSH